MGLLTWIRDLKTVVEWKDKEFNKIAAFFNVCTFVLTCAALVQPDWFKIKGIHCSKSFSLSQFFTFDDDGDDGDEAIALKNSNQFLLYSNSGVKGIPSCTSEEVVALMRILILLCFMVLLSSCIGIMVNLTALNTKTIKMLRRNAIPSIMCVFWVIAIVGVCYYTTVVFSSMNDSDQTTIKVDYEYGFYTITAAGAMSLLASAANLWGAPLSSDEDIQRLTLVEDWEGFETQGVGPTPSVPTLPPYSPTPDYLPPTYAAAVPSMAPPVSRYVAPTLGSRQMYPFHNINVITPPPPYSP